MGVPGEVIVLVPATATAPERFAVNPDLHILEPPERASLDRLVATGYAFRELESFVRARTKPARWRRSALRRSGRGGERRQSVPPRARPRGWRMSSPTTRAPLKVGTGHPLRGIVPALPAALESTLCEFALVLPSLWAVIRARRGRQHPEGRRAAPHHLRAASLAAGRRRSKTRCARSSARQARARTSSSSRGRARVSLVDPHGEFWVRPIVGAGGDGGVFLGGGDG